MAKKKKKAGIVAHQLPSGSYRVQLYIGKDESGKRIYKSFTDPDPDVAIMAARDYKENKDKPETITVGKAVERYIESKENVLSPSTIEGYRNIHKNRIESVKNIDAAEFDARSAQMFVNELSRDLSPKTVRNVWGLVSSAIYAYHPDRRYNITLPAKRKQTREMPEAKDVIAAIKGTDIELPALLAMWLSLRMSEVRGLKYKDITRNVLTVRRAVLLLHGGDVVREQTKTYSSTRRITLPPYLVRLIGKGDPDEFIVKMAKNTIYGKFTSCIEAAGLPHMRFHDLRHLNASIMLQLGIPEKYAMERGGWTTNSTLQNVYQHTFSAERSAVDDKVDAYFNKLLG